MRVLVDALAADFGGIRTYVENLLAAWEAQADELGDHLLVMVREGSDLDTGRHSRHEVRIPRPGPVGRPFKQSVLTRRLVADFDADAVLATMPSTSLVRVGVPLGVVIHDLRHELRPEQFSRPRRLLRKVAYDRAYALADVIVSVSQRSLDDLHRLHPRLGTTPAAVVHHGADHVLSWPRGEQTGTAITFAHHTNKNPDLVLDAWADGRRRGMSMPPLTVLGTGSQRTVLAARVAELGLADLVTLAPYLPEPEFRATMASASMIVFPSDFEGFGLPIVEGMLLGVPVVIGPEPASLEVAGGHASVMTSFSAPALANAVVRAGLYDAAHLDDARAHAAEFTWRRTVQQTRAALSSH
ncbi:glycosyltransferase [Nocardioides jensenii]|uniref:glycosyltransferase n=1 Tax=Nocardioides jensenii TaxID=1843 RepID=UPI0009E7450F|nr:glycosyltransferase [Nocardioides jensenii]